MKNTKELLYMIIKRIAIGSIVVVGICLYFYLIYLLCEFASSLNSALLELIVCLIGGGVIPLCVLLSLAEYSEF